MQLRYDTCMEDAPSLQSAIRGIAIATLGVIPVVFLPVTQDFYDTTKLGILALAASLLAMLSGIGLLINRKPGPVHISRGLVAYGALTAAALISLVIASTNKVDALMAPLGFVSMLSITIILVTLSRASGNLKTRLTWVFVGSSAVLGLISLYQFVGMGRVMFPGVPFLQDALWTPSGTTTSTVAIFIVSLALIIPRIRTSIGKSREQNALIFYISSFLIITAGLILTAMQFIPKITTSVLPLPTGWTIAFETLKQTKSAIAGMGAENFVSAYTAYKPVSMLTGSLWSMRFGVNANFFLHFATIYGLLGLLAAFLFTWQFLRSLRSQAAAACIVYVLCLFLIPPTLTLLSVGAVLFVLSDPEHESSSKPLSSLARLVPAICLLVLGAVGIYAVSRAYIGERQYFSALTAVQNSEGAPAYNLHVAAIRTNPYTMRYHITFSRIDLSLANSLVSKTGTKSDQNRQMISQLIQEAISEAKTAVTLNPESILAWENLGATYQVLMPVAQGADTWAAAAYQKALSLDPTNPVLAVNLGGVLVHEKKYDEAIGFFNQAIARKSDYANAYYNLANVYRLKGDKESAISALNQTLSLVPPDSSDYVKVKNELDALENSVTSPGTPAPTEPAGQSNLRLP